jgi:hypothetical protein
MTKTVNSPIAVPIFFIIIIVFRMFNLMASKFEEIRVRQHQECT